MKLAHSQDCSTVFLRSIYDRSCPRCAVVGKVILLRRKTILNGASSNEAEAAAIVAGRVRHYTASAPDNTHTEINI